MKKAALIFFIFFIILACVFAVITKNKQLQAENAWKDNVMNIQITQMVDNQEQHEELKAELSKVSVVCVDCLRTSDISQLLTLARQAVLDSLPARQEERYVSSAYCVATEMDNVTLRLDCKRYP